jgi:D-alanyl-D-alanine carboxypeptidase/D-alanyl-D-alanine-endopeptidase (penicillin-binding protein 4)
MKQGKYLILIRSTLLPVLILCIFLQASVLANGSGQVTPDSLRSLIARGGYAVQNNGRMIASQNQHEMFIPASTIKIATALTAIHVLGPDYRFETQFFRDADKNLYIKGFGDPFLISEEVAAIVRKLKDLGCREINDIYLDDTAFAVGAIADGAGGSDNPYDARNSALGVNFNTVNIEKDQDGNVQSAEEQTPSLDLMKELAADLDPGVHRINITQESSNGDAIIRRYTGELFRALQRRENIGGNGRIAFRKVPANLVPFYIHQSSRTLQEIIEPLLLYSNNFIANQIFLAMGAVKYGYPATWEKSIRTETGYLQDQLDLSQNDIRIAEGSGLSRKNRVTPDAMIRLLDSFKPYSRLLPRKDDVLVKSGTLQDVYAYAGYFIGKGRLDSFVLLLNQEKNNRDEILRLLEQVYRTR